MSSIVNINPSRFLFLVIISDPSFSGVNFRSSSAIHVLIYLKFLLVYLIRPAFVCAITINARSLANEMLLALFGGVIFITSLYRMFAQVDSHTEPCGNSVYVDVNCIASHSPNASIFQVIIYHTGELRRYISPFQLFQYQIS